MTQYPLTPVLQPDPDRPQQTPRRETEREIFERIANTMREDQRRERRSRAYARLRRIFGGGRSVAPGSRRVARHSLIDPDGAGRQSPSRPVVVLE